MHLLLSASILEHPEALEVNDSTFAQEVLAAKGPVAVLVYGGCEACSEDVRIFNELASVARTKATFAKIDLDNSPQACAKLGVSKCPTVLVVTGGSAAQERLYNVTDPGKIKAFIGRHTLP